MPATIIGHAWHRRERGEDGSGVEQVQVVLSPDGASSDGRVSALTDASGRAAFPNVPPGTYQLLARRIGYTASRTQIVAVAGKVDSLVVPLGWDRMQLCVIVRTGPPTH